MRKYFYVLLAVAFLITGCATDSKLTKDITVKAAADPKANFSGYKTYAWLGAAEILNDPNKLWEPPNFDADAEVKFLIDSQLRDRGLTKVTENPDMVVAFTIGIDMEALEIKMNPETKIETLTNVPEGALMVILVDAETGYAIWAGSANGEIDKYRSTDDVKARLKNAVSRMFNLMPE